MNDSTPTFIAFHGNICIARGTLADVLGRVRAAASTDSQAPVLVFDASTSEQLDFSPHEGLSEIQARLSPAPPAVDDSAGSPAKPSGPGRPRLGVVAREVTLLPRHWEWLASQPGGASVVLRKLVDQARREGQPRDTVRRSQECSYRFMAAMAGNLPGFEEAARALFAGHATDFAHHIAAWPTDVRAHVQGLATAAFAAAAETTGLQHA